VFYHPVTPVDSQPLFHAQPGSPPALLLAGSADDLVDPKRNTEQLARALAEQQVPVDSAILNDLGHIKILLTLAAPFQHWAPVIQRISCFIDAQAGSDGAESPSSDCLASREEIM